MMRNYFKIMIRNLWKRKVFTLINLLGLSFGMAVCILLALYIQNELGYDQFQERGDQIYRLAMERIYPGRSAFKGKIPRSVGPAVKKEFPEVLECVRVMDNGPEKVRIDVDGKQFSENKILTADSNFFRVFTGNFLLGAKQTALQKPGTVVLNETTATKFFGSPEKAMGRGISINGSPNKFIVAGVCDDWPAKSHLQFNILTSTSGLQFMNQPEYVYFGPYTYLLVNKNASAAALESKLPLVVNKYVGPVIAPLFGEPYKQFVTEGNGYRYFLQPIKDIHLNSNLEDELLPTGSMRTIRLLGVIAIFILFLACINFINLSTAVSLERAREVGIRKTFGSGRYQLVRQFIAEAVLFSLFCMIVAMLLVFLLIPVMNNISGNDLSFDYLLEPWTLALVFAFSILVGLLAGLYPALVLSSFQPMMVLKGKFRSNRMGIALRNGLVIFQFSISVILIICTIIVNMQMSFMTGDRVGFKQDHIIAIERVGFLRGRSGDDHRMSFTNEISKIAGVENVTECDQLPGSDETGGGGTWVALDNNASRTQKIYQADDHYARLLDLEMKEGRFFSKDYSTDSLSVILNEKAVEDFGLKNPIGARLISKEPGLNPSDGKSQYVFTVVGVLKDFHYQSMHRKIAPLIIINSNKFGWGSLGVRIRGNQFKPALAEIEKTWKQFDPTDPFLFDFLDQNLAAQYKSEQTEQKIFTMFSLLAILIASVGLFGLAAYSSIQRSREIGIRRVLGAMPGNIIMILSRDFLMLVVIASFIAFPLAGWAMHKWLQNFSYRVDISWWVFLLAGSIAALIAMLTISYQAIRAAVANPVKACGLND
jgi:putative ABC transport system permease protein